MLGTWHIYQHASVTLYQAFLPLVLGHMIHNVTPRAKILINPRIRYVAQVFSLLRLAFPSTLFFYPNGTVLMLH